MSNVSAKKNTNVEGKSKSEDESGIQDGSQKCKNFIETLFSIQKYHCNKIIKALINKNYWSFIKRQTSGTSNSNEWQRVVQRATTNGNELQRVATNENVLQRMTMSDTTNYNKQNNESDFRSQNETINAMYNYNIFQ